MKEFLAKKVKMTTVYNKDGQAEAVTILRADPLSVVEKKGQGRVLIAFNKLKKPTRLHPQKPILGILKKAKIKQLFRSLAEINYDQEIEPGQEIKFDEAFKEGDIVDAVGISKGKGFSGTIKRWGFSRGPESHGSHNVRQPGSIGAMGPQEVQKGKKMPGRHGGVRKKIKNLKILKIEPAENLIYLKGAVPGGHKSTIRLIKRKSTKQ